MRALMEADRLKTIMNKVLQLANSIWIILQKKDQERNQIFKQIKCLGQVVLNSLKEITDHLKDQTLQGSKSNKRIPIWSNNQSKIKIQIQNGL